MTSDTPETPKTNTPIIPQPTLRELRPNERIVRTAGLKFILPNQWKEGDVLTAEHALFINTAYHTAVLNRFATIRQAMFEDGKVPTYKELDTELQAFFETFKVTNHPAKPPTPEKPAKDEAWKRLDRFARPVFNKHIGGMGVPRSEYESMLVEWITENRSMLEALADAEDAAIESLGADLVSLG